MAEFHNSANHLPAYMLNRRRPRHSLLHCQRCCGPCHTVQQALVQSFWKTAVIKWRFIIISTYVYVMVNKFFYLCEC